MALGLIGGAILSSFLQVAFQSLASREVLDFFRGKRLDETLLNKLNICFISINAGIDDAEQKEITNPNVKAWLNKVKDAVYDAEDVLDEIDYEVTKRMVEAESQSNTMTRKEGKARYASKATRHFSYTESIWVILLKNLNAISGTIHGLDGVVAVGPEFYGNNSCTAPFASLEILRFEEMKGWEEWNCEDVDSAFPCLHEFYLEGCSKLRELHIPAQLPFLTKLVIVNCEQLVASLLQAPSIHELVLENGGKVQLECLPSTLKVLRIGEPFTECFSVEKFENMIADTCLEELRISNWASLEFPLMHGHNFLQELRIESCDSLSMFPLDLFPKLRMLQLRGCGKLETVSIVEKHNNQLTSLAFLEIIDRHKFASFPKGGFSAPKLDHFLVEDLKSLKSFPAHMHILFPALEVLHITGCPQVESFSGSGLPRNLKGLVIGSSPKLTASRMEWGLHNHTCLQWLTIQDEAAECLPDADLLPSTLTELYFKDCLNLRTLDYKGLRYLSTLRKLHLIGCDKLQCFPKEGLPSSIHSLRIWGSAKLKRQCQNQKGPSTSNWLATHQDDAFQDTCVALGIIRSVSPYKCGSGQLRLRE
ncbi:putative disease resistance protein At3g14460 [Prosopis cineraria]|uniref:putative disease resistance protein At3g14460 n=1 Tax=Prosopis cineraria TaxID=364024 RepID=UPI0024104E08|nr:putative disease resistance protein At3g14460 [Prosopis cineraria]